MIQKLAYIYLWLNCMCIYNNTFNIWQLWVMLHQNEMFKLRLFLLLNNLENKKDNWNKEIKIYYLQSPDIESSFFTKLSNSRAIIMAKHSIS